MGLTTRKLRYVCPQCRANLAESAEAYHCLSCGRRYPIVLGIPDFRLFADPYISIEDDYRKARVLAERAAEMTFAELLDYYWRMTPEVPRVLISQYVHGAIRHQERSRATWAMIQSTDDPAERGGLLDIGCGTAGFLAAAAPAFSWAVGIDIAFRWLVVARKRLEELQMRNVALVCGCAESLPFLDAAFDLVVAEDVLDHTRDQAASVQEGARTLRRGGVFYLTTPNRYSLAPDPHVWVWGVGFPPPRLRDWYLQRRKGIPYGPIRPVSYVAPPSSELGGFTKKQIRLARTRRHPVAEVLALAAGAAVDIRTRPQERQCSDTSCSSWDPFYRSFAGNRRGESSIVKRMFASRSREAPTTNGSV